MFIENCLLLWLNIVSYMVIIKIKKTKLMYIIAAGPVPIHKGDRPPSVASL